MSQIGDLSKQFEVSVKGKNIKNLVDSIKDGLSNNGIEKKEVPYKVKEQKYTN